MILRAKHNFVIYPFFKRYALWIIRRSFSKVQILGSLNDKNKPVLLISNHISWWDGFWAMYLNRYILKRRFHFMMLEEQLRKFWFFNYAGGFSVKKNTRSMVESLNYTAELLNDSKNMVLMFPQGEIESMHQQNFVFEKGIERVLEGKDNKVQIVFMANLVDYFSQPKPCINIYIQEYSDQPLNFEAIEKSYNQFFARSIEKQKSIKFDI